MGGNGSKAGGSLESESGRRWKTVMVLPSGVKILEPKATGSSLKLPEESHTPNSIYAIFKKDGSGVKSIAQYGDDCKKIYEIHLDHDQHHGNIGPHYHKWANGKPGDAINLDSDKQQLVNQIKHLQ